MLHRPTTRRNHLATLAALGAASLLPPLMAGRAAANAAALTRPVPATGEALPVIGMGTWITFNVGNDPAARAVRSEILQAFFAAGGAVIDSSPMYGSSQDVVGYALNRLGRPSALFSADKVWTPFGGDGPEQIAASAELWGIQRFDLLQVHNLVAWREHLATLRAMKEDSRLRYLGVTTSHGRRHDELEQIMRSEPLDFVQLTYNLLDREAEQRLLPLAAERGIGVIVNRPFRRGELLDRLERHPLPGWAAELECDAWSQVALKFIVSHPAVTCAIPATSRVDHMRENMAALRGPLPDRALRRRMVADIQAL